jgi:hypothetical protein
MISYRESQLLSLINPKIGDIYLSNNDKKAYIGGKLNHEELKAYIYDNSSYDDTLNGLPKNLEKYFILHNFKKYKTNTNKYNLGDKLNIKLDDIIFNITIIEVIKYSNTWQYVIESNDNRINMLEKDLQDKIVSTKIAQLKRVLENLDKPTEIFEDGTKVWYNKEGKYHRLNDKPAFIKPDGTKFWYINGKRHRENDKPSAEFIDGGKTWYINDKFIKRNYDSNRIIHNDKFFDVAGNEIKTTTAQLKTIVIKPNLGDVYTDDKNKFIFIGGSQGRIVPRILDNGVEGGISFDKIDHFIRYLLTHKFRKIKTNTNKYKLGETFKLIDKEYKIVSFEFHSNDWSYTLIDDDNNTIFLSQLQLDNFSPHTGRVG